MATSSGSQSKSFGHQIKAARIRLGLTQQRICVAVTAKLQKWGDDDQLTQATLSAWETGRQRPSDQNRKIVLALADVLQLDVEDVEKFAFGATTQVSAPEDQYIRDLGEWLLREDVGHENTNFWFVAPKEIPALSSEKILDFWAENLNCGVGYHFLWVLNWLKEPETFDELSAVLAKLSFKLSGDGAPQPKGMLNLYLFDLKNADTKYEEYEVRQHDVEYLQNSFQALSKAGENDPSQSYIKVEKLERGPDSDQTLLLSLASLVPPEGRLAVYVPKSFPYFDPHATIFFPRTAERLHDESSPKYLWLPADTCLELKQLVHRVERWVTRKNTGRGND